MAGVLKSRRQLYIYGDTNINAMADLVGQMQHFTEEEKSLELLISSTGGNVDAAFTAVDMMNALKNSGVKIRTIGLGNIDSSAILLLASGTIGQRFMLQKARTIMHELSMRFDTPIGMTTTAWEQMIANGRRNQDRYWELMVCASKHAIRSWSVHDLQNRFERKGNIYLTAEDMESYGWVDEVIDVLPSPLTPPFK